MAGGGPRVLLASSASSLLLLLKQQLVNILQEQKSAVSLDKWEKINLDTAHAALQLLCPLLC